VARARRAADVEGIQRKPTPGLEPGTPSLRDGSAVSVPLGEAGAIGRLRPFPWNRLGAFRSVWLPLCCSPQGTPERESAGPGP
jgi:hypothetical protein